MSFLKQAYALEQEVLEEVTDVDGDDFFRYYGTSNCSSLPS